MTLDEWCTLHGHGSVAQLARETGIGEPTMYRYRNGRQAARASNNAELIAAETYACRCKICRRYRSHKARLTGAVSVESLRNPTPVERSKKRSRRDRVAA
ncbi:MAG TPA: hypothetical protein VGI70_18270 [Polyangiales bacterium]